MKATKITLLIWAGVMPILAIAQTAERQVIGVAGSFSTALSGQSHSYTVGEAVIVTATSPTIILTQGFQQPPSTTVGIEEPAFGLAVNAYPNPTSGEVILDLLSDQPLQLNIQLFNVQGKLLRMPHEIVNVSGVAKHIINLSDVADGNYFIRITDKTGILNRTINVQKVN